ncbi:hypothetical protein HZ996_12450 [Cryomorphaceae bacterium]|nr:hypothetical protein HZ996_12450 [Cryomorphaceae bacterium]
MLRSFFIGLLLLLVLSGCGNEEQSAASTEEQIEILAFDSELWSTWEKGQYPYRPSMLDAVMEMDSLRYLKETEITEVLGQPDRQTEGHLYYRISDTKLVTWTLHAQTLVIVLEGDTGRHKMLIHE